MKNTDTLNTLCDRTFTKCALESLDFECTLMFILQDKLEFPQEKISLVLRNSFNVEEPLSWREVHLDSISVVVLNERDKDTLSFIDLPTGAVVLCLSREELRA